VPGQAATPVPGKVDYIGQSDPLGGDKENPMSFAPNSNFGAEEGFESDGYILEDELNRVREIAGTQVVQELSPPKTGGAIPEIKASTKEKAIEIARKKGIAKFRFCGKYKVKDAKKPNQSATPKPGPGRFVSPPIADKGEKLQGVTTNPMGDFDPTAFSGDFTGGTKR
jgi:hypothetical protein